MENISANTIPSTIKPLHDTWNIRADTGAWSINLSLDFASLSAQDINAWHEKTFVGTIESFSELIRVYEVDIITDREGTEGTALKWTTNSSYNEYVRKTAKKIKEFNAAIDTLEIQVDLFVFIRTEESPETPVRGWVRHLGKFAFCSKTFTGKPYIYFEIDHTLFCSSSSYEDNTELYDLNQPLLEKALRNWEQKVGTINEYDGLEGIYKYGFLPDE